MRYMNSDFSSLIKYYALRHARDSFSPTEQLEKVRQTQPTLQPCSPAARVCRKLRPCVTEAATPCKRGGNPVRWAAAPCVPMGAAAPCAKCPHQGAADPAHLRGNLARARDARAHGVPACKSRQARGQPGHVGLQPGYAGWQLGPTHRGLQPGHVRLQGCCSTARAKVPSTGRNATPCLPCANHVLTMCLQEEDVAFGGRATNRSPRKFWSVSLLFDQATQLN